jgi:hypothetical protein
MRFIDDDGLTWTVRDVALLPERAMVEPGHPDAIERYFVNTKYEKLVYHFTKGEPRTTEPARLARQLRIAKESGPQRQSDPNLFKV